MPTLPQRVTLRVALENAPGILPPVEVGELVVVDLINNLDDHAVLPAMLPVRKPPIHHCFEVDRWGI